MSKPEFPSRAAVAVLTVVTLGAVSALTQEQGDPTLTEVWEPEPAIVSVSET